jgi:excisionase family DNA binding protein
MVTERENGRIKVTHAVELPDIDKDFLTVAQAALICMVTRVTMWRWVKSGGIRSSATVGGHHRISRADLVQFIQMNKMGPRIQNDSSKRRILIVDDELALQRYLTRVLKNNGYEVQVCTDGFEAGVYVMKLRPHLILLDLFMPRMNAFQTCRLIKGEPETAHIKIIAISGNSPETIIDRILKCGADGFLQKPLDNKTVIQQIESIVET